MFSVSKSASFPGSGLRAVSGSSMRLEITLVPAGVRNGLEEPPDSMVSALLEALCLVSTCVGGDKVFWLGPAMIGDLTTSDSWTIRSGLPEGKILYWLSRVEKPRVIFVN